MSGTGDSVRHGGPAAEPAGVPAVLIALREIQWMARRAAADAPREHKRQVNAATWLLDALLGRFGVQPCRPDETISPADRGSGAVREPASVWVRGTQGFVPDDEQRLAWTQVGVPGQVQFVADTVVAWATLYTEGAGPWTVGLIDQALDVLSTAGWLRIQSAVVPAPRDPLGPSHLPAGLWVAS